MAASAELKFWQESYLDQNYKAAQVAIAEISWFEVWYLLFFFIKPTNMRLFFCLHFHFVSSQQSNDVLIQLN